MRQVSLLALPAVLALAGCATSQNGADPSLIMDPSVSGELRQAATCLTFNAEVDRFLSGIQLEMYDYNEAAEFWASRLVEVEPDGRVQQEILDSALVRQAQDFSPAPRNMPANVQRFESSYAAVISACQSARSALVESEAGASEK